MGVDGGMEGYREGMEAPGDGQTWGGWMDIEMDG